MFGLIYLKYYYQIRMKCVSAQESSTFAGVFYPGNERIGSTFTFSNITSYFLREAPNTQPTPFAISGFKTCDYISAFLSHFVEAGPKPILRVQPPPSQIGLRKKSYLSLLKIIVV